MGMTRGIIAPLVWSALASTLPKAAIGGNLSNCKEGCFLGEKCVGNPFSQPVSDDECYPCASGQYWWPCNFETLCFCNKVDKHSPRVPPAPRSVESENKELDVCGDILPEEVFDQIVKPKTPEGKHLFSYQGLCAAIGQYNAFHHEKFAAMGNEQQMRGELAAFFAHVAADTQNYEVFREEHHCVDPITGADGRVYCKPCREEHYDKKKKKCAAPFVTKDKPYTEYCDKKRQGPQGCACLNVTAVDVPMPPDAEPRTAVDMMGYVPAGSAYFRRGAIALSWNYEYFGASMALTGNPYGLCENADLVSTIPQYAWGAGIYKWMEKMQFGTTGTTAHKEVLRGNFGATVEILYGELECPSNEWTSLIHVDLVQQRVDEVCKAGAALGVYLEMDKCNDKRGKCLKCDGLKELYDTCIKKGKCPKCEVWQEYVKSMAPTVAPPRVESPGWDEWAHGRSKPDSGGVRIGRGTTFFGSLIVLLAGASW